ncbi:MAG: hypothetical protein WB611_11160 [Stellaceae bacterium]
MLLALIRSPGVWRFFSRIFRRPELASRSTSDRPNRSIGRSVSFEQLVEVVTEPWVPRDLIEQFEHHTGAEPVDLLN